jgi:putative transposase
MKTNSLSPLASPASESRHETGSESEAGLYYFTIYTHRQKTRLGRITRRGIKPNALGRTAETHWQNLSRVFPNIRLDTFTLMPDRIHGIIEIEEGSPHGIAAILRTFKSFSAREINKMQQTPGNMIWQQAHDERVLHEGNALEETQALITGAPARWRTDRQHRLNPVSRQHGSQKGASTLNWLVPSFFAVGH